MSKEHTFLVTAKDTEGCKKLGFMGKYRIRLCPTILQLLKHDFDSEVTHWPLYGLRKYGFSSREFFIEAGTRCKTGEGKFSFLTFEGKDIVQCLSEQVHQIINQNRNEGKWQDEEKLFKKDQCHGNVCKQLTKNDLKHNVHTEFEREFQGMSLKDSGPPFFHSDNEEENDYYNAGSYSHLHGSEQHSTANAYGMVSASAPFKFSEEKKTGSSEYEYVNF